METRKGHRGEVVMSRFYGSKISGTQQTVVLQMWQKKNTKNINIDINGDFPAFDCTQEQNVSPRLTM